MASPVLPAQFKALISDPTASMCGNFTNTLLKLPVLLYQLANYMFTADGLFTAAFTKMIADLTLRPGDYIMSGAPLDEVGRLLCDGRAVSRSTYADLFTAIGTTYGVGDGSLTFNLPDFRDRFPKGKNAEALGATGGSATATLDLTNIPPHNHNILVDGTSDVTVAEAEGVFHASGVLNFEATDTATAAGETQNAGGSGSPAAAQPFNVLNPNIAVFVYVKI